MNQIILLQGPHRDFESIKKIDKNKIEYWMARELMPLLGYTQWRNFEEVVGKAARACIESGQFVDNHFARASKMVRIGSDTVREVPDYKLDRYACYLIAQNGDSKKQEIALAQTYFAIQTHKQEQFEKYSEAEKRLYVRGEVKTQNKQLAGTAKAIGVTQFGSFNDAGYRGLYGMPLIDIEQKKGIKKGELLDRAGVTELAANLFRITQTKEKLIKEDIRGERLASRVHNMVGRKVRKTIKDIGGVLPEDLPIEKHIKELKQDLRKQKKLRL